MAIKIVLFDDNKHIRESLEMMFGADDRFVLKGAHDNANRALEIVSREQPDIVLMDIDMPGKNGIDAVQEIHKAFPDLAIMMLTVFDDSDRVFESLRNGATGYMLKSTAPEKLIESILVIADGGAAMSPSIAKKVMNQFREEVKSAPVDYHLSSRERDVLTLLVEGLSYKMIADRLGIGFETVRTHIKKIYDKLHVQTMTEAVVKTIREGLL